MGAKGLLAGGAVATIAATPAAAATPATGWINVTAAPYNADPTGGVDASPAFAAAIKAAAAGGVVYVPAGNYTIGSTVRCSTVPVYFVGDGAWASVISYTGSGDCFYVYDSSDYGSRQKFAGGFVGITLDGTRAQAGATGLHLGDLLQYELDLTVQNFTGTGAIGVHLDNNYYWTEQLYGRIYAQRCTSHVVFDWTVKSTVTTSSGSFERCDLDVYINQDNANYDGVVFRNGAFITNGSLKVRGNFGYSTTAVTSAALRFAGGVVNANKYSSAPAIIDSMIDVGVECASKTGAYTPQTIVFDTSDSSISGCYGALNFGAAGNTFSPSNNAKNVWNFLGHTTGDANLPGGWATYNTGFPDGITGHVSFRFLPTGNEVMVSWAFDIRAGTTLHNGDPIVTVSPKFAYNDNKIIPGNNAGADLTGNVYAPAYLTKDAVFKYCGPTYQGAGASWWYGQGIYTLSLG
ncbi:MAG TPA: glycosyl hydrolase family 28-related protein [Pseudonocardiaceae bacterium]|nr:glycosyl hydrolase family 28-related protein [Pseudonocardiaceae bacterium]